MSGAMLSVYIFTILLATVCVYGGPTAGAHLKFTECAEELKLSSTDHELVHDYSKKSCLHKCMWEQSGAIAAGKFDLNEILKSTAVGQKDKVTKCVEDANKVGVSCDSGATLFQCVDDH